MAGVRATAALAAVLLVVLCAVQPTWQRGTMRVDHVFASAGRVVSAERLNSDVADVGTAAVDQLGFGGFDELKLTSAGLEIGGSYTEVSTEQSLSLSSATSTVNLNAGRSLYSFAETVKFTSTERTVLIDAPRGTVSNIGFDAIVEGGGVELTSGLQGTTIASHAGDVAVSSTKSDISIRGGGAADFTAYTEMEVLARDGSISVQSTFERGTAGLYGQERVVIDALRNLAMTTSNEDGGDITFRAGDVMDLAAGNTIALSFQAGLDIRSISDTVEIDAAQKATLSSFTALQIVGGEEGVQIKSEGEDLGKLTIQTGLGNVVLSGETGGVDLSSEENIEATVSTGEFSVTSDGLVFGGSSVTLGDPTGLTQTAINASRSVTWDAVNYIQVDATDIAIEQTDSLIKMTSGAVGTIRLDSERDTVWESGSVFVYGDGHVTGGSQTGSTTVEAGGDILLTNVRGDGIGGGDILVHTDGEMEVVTFTGNMLVTGGDAVFTGESVYIDTVQNELTLTSALDQESTIHVDALNFTLSSGGGSTGGVSFVTGDSLLADLTDSLEWESTGGNSFIRSEDGGRISFIGARDLNVESTTSDTTIDALENIYSTNHGLELFGTVTADVDSDAGDTKVSTQAHISGKAQRDIDIGAPIAVKLWTYENVGLDDRITLSAQTDGPDGLRVAFTSSLYDSHKDVSFTSTLNDTLLTYSTSAVVRSGFEDSLIEAGGAASVLSTQAINLLGEYGHFYSEVDNVTVLAETGSMTFEAAVRGVRVAAAGEWSITAEKDAEIELADVFETRLRGDGLVQSTVTDVAVTGGEAVEFTSTGGDVSFTADVDVSITTGRDVFFSTAEDTGDTLGMDVQEDVQLTGSTLLRGGVSSGLLQFTADEDVRFIAEGGDLVLAGSDYTTHSRGFNSTADTGNYHMLGGAISLTSTRDDITIDAAGDLTLRSNAEVNHHVVTGGVTDEISFNSKQHLLQDAAGGQALYEATAVRIDTHRFGVDDDFDGDVLLFATDILVDSAESHDNDVRLHSGGPVSINAGTGASNALMQWQFDHDALIEAAETVWFDGHTDGGFVAQAFGPGNVDIEASAGRVLIDYDGKDLHVAGSRSVFKGGAPVGIDAHDQVDFESATHIFFNAEGHRPNENAFGSPLQARDAGILVRSSDTSGNVALEARNAYVRIRGGTPPGATPVVRVESPEIVTLQGFDGVQFDNERNTIVESQDGAVQVQGDRGAQLNAQSDIAMEASRLLSIEVVDLLEVVAGNDISVRAEAGDVTIATEFFKDVRVEDADVLDIVAGASGIRVKSEDDQTWSAGDIDIIGDRALDVETLAGPLLVAAPAVTITAEEELTGSAGRDLVVSGSKLVSVVADNIEMNTLGGAIDMEADSFAVVAESVLLRSGLGSSPQSNADRTLLSGEPVTMSSTSGDFIIDSTDIVRFGFETFPTLQMKAVAGALAVETSGNMFVDTDMQLTATAPRNLNVVGGREGVELTSVGDFDITSNFKGKGKAGVNNDVRVFVPKSLFDIHAADTVSVEATLDIELIAGGLLELQTSSSDAATASMVISSPLVTFTAFDAELSAPTINYVITDTWDVDAAEKIDISSTDVTIAGENNARFGALGRSEYVVTNDFGSLVMETAGGGTQITVDTSEPSSDVRFVTPSELQIHNDGGDTFFKTPKEITISAVGSDTDSVGDVDIDAEGVLMYAERSGVVSAFDELTVDALTGDMVLLGGTYFDANAAGDLAITNDPGAAQDITLQGLNVEVDAITGDVTFDAAAGFNVVSRNDTELQAGGDLLFTSTLNMELLAVGEEIFDLPFSNRTEPLSLFFQVLDEDAELLVETALLLMIEVEDDLFVTAGVAKDLANIALTAGTAFNVFSEDDIDIIAEDQGPTRQAESTDPPILIDNLGTGDLDITPTGEATIDGATVKLSSIAGTTVSSNGPLSFFANHSSIELSSLSTDLSAVNVQFVSDGPNLDPELGVPGIAIEGGSGAVVDFEVLNGQLTASANQDVRIDSTTLNLFGSQLTLRAFGEDERGSTSDWSVLISAEDVVDVDVTSVMMTVGTTGSISFTSHKLDVLTTGLTMAAADRVEISAHGTSGAAEGIQIDVSGLVITSTDTTRFQAGDSVVTDITNELSAINWENLLVDGDFVVRIEGDLTISTDATQIVGRETVVLESLTDPLVLTSTDARFVAGIGNDEALVQFRAVGQVRHDTSSIFNLFANNDVLSRSRTWDLAGTNGGVTVNAPQGDIMLRAIDVDDATNSPVQFTGAAGSSTFVQADALSHRQHRRLNLGACDGTGVMQQFATSGRAGLYPTDCRCANTGAANQECNCPHHLHQAIDVFTAMRNYGLLSPNIQA